MSTHHSNTASGWFDNADTGDWGKRFRDTARSVLQSFDTGFQAAHDYRKLAAHGRAQQAVEAVFQKHFSKR